MFLSLPEGMAIEAVAKFSAACAIAIGGLGPGLAIGIGVRGAMEAIGRNPEAENAIRAQLDA